MDIRLYFLLLPLTVITYLRRNIDNKSSQDLRLYSVLIPRPFNLLKRNIDEKSYYFPLIPSTFDTYLRRNIDDESSVYL